MDGIVFKDIDIVKAGRAMVIDANDTAVIQNTKFEDIRIEAADTNLIDLEEDTAPTWRTAPNTSIAKDTFFTNVSADVNQADQHPRHIGDGDDQRRPLQRLHGPGQGSDEPDGHRRQLEHQSVRLEHHVPVRWHEVTCRRGRPEPWPAFRRACR